MKRKFFTKLILYISIFFCVSFNIYIATDINKLKYLTTLTNIEYIAMAQYENQWDASIAAGYIVFGAGGEATFQDSFGEFWSNGFMRDEWGEMKPCPNEQNSNLSVSGSSSRNVGYRGASTGSSNSGTITVNNTSSNYQGQMMTVCHDGGSANCDESRC